MNRSAMLDVGFGAIVENDRRLWMCDLEPIVAKCSKCREHTAQATRRSSEAAQHTDAELHQQPLATHRAAKHVATAVGQCDDSLRGRAARQGARQDDVG